MRWDEDPQFSFNNTYEQDIKLKRVFGFQSLYISGLTSEAYTQGRIGCFPVVRYSASTLPEAYLDTRFNADEGAGICDDFAYDTSYTIGSAAPHEIIENDYHVNYFYADRGNAVKPVYSLEAQLGELRPRWCAFRNLPGCGLDYDSETFRHNCETDNPTWCSWKLEEFEIDSFESTKDYDQEYPYWYQEYEN